jgi:uncharacterized protein YcfJ
MIKGPAKRRFPFSIDSAELPYPGLRNGQCSMANDLEKGGTTMKRKMTAFVLALALALPAGAMAKPWGDRDGDRDDDRDDIQYARVVNVRPIFRAIWVRVPEQQCWDERVVNNGGYYRPNRAASTVAGGAIGGLIGSSVSRGDARIPATFAGVMMGAIIGNAVASDGFYHAPARIRTVQRCQTVMRSRSEQQIDGYWVQYKYRGRIYEARLDDQPGKWIAGRVDATPVVE